MENTFPGRGMLLEQRAAAAAREGGAWLRPAGFPGPLAGVGGGRGGGGGFQRLRALQPQCNEISRRSWCSFYIRYSEHLRS